MAKFVELHGRDGGLVVFNVESVHAIYFDEEENATAIDYGFKETFFIKEPVEQVEVLITEFERN